MPPSASMAVLLQDFKVYCALYPKTIFGLRKFTVLELAQALSLCAPATRSMTLSSDICQS